MFSRGSSDISVRNFVGRAFCRPWVQADIAFDSKSILALAKWEKADGGRMTGWFAGLDAIESLTALRLGWSLLFSARNLPAPTVFRLEPSHCCRC